MIYNKQNKKFLEVDSKLIHVQLRTLKDINTSDIELKIINYVNYINDYTSHYRLIGDKKKFNIRLKLTTELQDKFKELDKLGINIKYFIKYLIEHEHITEIKKDKIKREEIEFDFTNIEEQVISLEDLKSENNLDKTYNALIKQVKFNNTRKTVVEYKNSILEDIKKLAIESKIEMYGKLYKANHIQVRIDKDKTSKELSLILDFYKKIIFYSKDEIIDDSMRFKMLKSYYEVMNLKRERVHKELKSIGYDIENNGHDDFEYYKGYINKISNGKGSELYQHSYMVDYVEKNLVLYDSTKFSYISSGICKADIKDFYVQLPQNLRKSEYQSGYIMKNKTSKKQIAYFDNDKKIDKEKYIELKSVNPNGENLYTKIVDSKYLNVFGDTETNAKFFKIVDGEHIEITREEFLKLLNENIEFLSNLPEKLKARLSCDETTILDKTPLIDLLVKNKIYQKTDLQIIQAYFHNAKTDQEVINIWVNEKQRKYYDEQTLKYNFTQKLNDKNIDRDVEANIIYTKELTNDFMLYTNNWYEMNIDKTTNHCPQLTIWFHNLKFDMLSTNMLGSFHNFNLDITNFNDSTPRFYMFESQNEIKMKTKLKKPKILFLDSYNFSPSTLKDMGVNIGINKETEKTDFKDNDNIFKNKEQTRNLLEYSLMDVVILKEFICNLKDEILKYTTVKYGSAGTALSCFLTSFYDDSFWYKNKTTGKTISKEEYNNLSDDKKFNYFRDNIRIHKHRNKYLEAVEQYAYIGGHTEVFNKVGLVLNIKSLDVNSSYPSSMLQKLPRKFIYSVVNPTLDQFAKLHKKSDIYTISKIFIPDDKSLIVPIKNEMRIEYPYLKNTTTWLHEPELKLLLKYNTDIKIKETLCYSATSKLFESYVEHWMFEKSFNKREDINNPLKVDLSKLFANSCYGKLGERLRLTECRKMTEDDIELFTMLLNNRDEIEYTKDEILKYNGYVDVPLVAYDREMHDKFYNHPTITELAENTNRFDTNTMRVSFINGYMSYSKKISIGGKNTSFALVGAITAYSRVELLKCLKLLGEKNNVYCDTDSNYTKYKKEQLKNINEMVVSKEDLKYMYTSKKAYKEIIEKYENIASKNPDKIHICRALVSKYYFWEWENKGNKYHILTRGNKDNLKMHDIHKKEVFIEGETGTYEEFINSDFKYIIRHDNKDKINTCLKNNKYFCKLSERLKGVPKNVLCENENLYFYPNWLSPNMQKILFGSLDGQYITYALKTQESSRMDYPKAQCITGKGYRTKKSISMINIKPIVEDFEIIKDKYEFNNVLTYSYYDYKIKPYEVEQKDGEFKYIHDNSKAI